MGRSRQDIVNSLMEQSQTDPMLASVASSLVGRELLYFGANVIYQLENLGDSVTNFADIGRVDMQQLIAYAYTHDVPCDTIKPAIITITLNNMPDEVYLPFSIRMDVGSCRFYNIDFVKGGQQILLYQGKPYTMRSQQNAILDAFGLDTGLGADLNTATWATYKEFIRGKFQSSYVKLGANVVSDSVRVFARKIGEADGMQGIVFPYTEFNQQLASPSAKLYKVRTGWDRSINVLFGDENWAMVIAQELYNYQLYWLEATTLNYTISSQDVLYLGYGATTPIKSKFDSKAPLTPYYTVNAHTSAETGSLPYAKNYVSTKLFAQNGLVTEQQIINYLAVLDSINSSTVVTDADGTISIWIKPVDPDNKAFGFVQDYLYQYGVAGTTYKVEAASPIKFRVSLTPVGSEGLLAYARAQQIIDEYCDYQNLRIDSKVSSAILMQQVERFGITSVTVKVTVSDEPVVPSQDGNHYLSARPEVNTIKQYNRSGALVGYDANGLYFSIGETLLGSKNVKYISAAGDFIFVCTDYQSWLFTYDIYGGGARFYGVETTSYIQDKNNNPVIGQCVEYVRDTESIYILDASQQKIYKFAGGWFKDGEGSIIRNQVHITPISVTNYTGTVMFSMPTALWGDYLWGYINDGTISCKNNTMTQPININVDLNANPFFVLNGVLYVLPKGDQAGLYINIGLGSFTAESINSMTPTSTPLGSQSANGTQLLDARQVDGFLMTLSTNSEKTKAFINKGRLTPGQAYHLTAETPVIEFDGTVPTRILSVRNGYIYLTNGTMMWVVYPSGASDVYSYSIADSLLAAATGNVDYTAGIIYDIPYSANDYLDYDVAGTVGKVGSYPMYVK